MPAILKTTKDSKHYHVVYLNEQSGQAYCGEAGTAKSKHMHSIRWVEPVMEPVVDPETGQPMVDPQTGQPVPPEEKAPGYWMIEPAPDGHTHAELEAYEGEYEEEKESEEQVCRDVIEIYKTCVETDGDSLERANESLDFVNGKQWKDDEKSALKSENRACLTLNYTAMRLDTLVGFQRSQRTDIRYLAQGNGDQRTADMYNIVAKDLLTKSYFGYRESEVFRDAAGLGRGWFNVFVDFDDNIEGEVKIERFPFSQVVTSSHNDPLCDDAEAICKGKMYSYWGIKAKWPDKADKIQKDLDWYTHFGRSREKITENKRDNYAFSDNRTPAMIGKHTLVDFARKEFRVIECQRKIWKKRYIISFPGDGFTTAIDGMKENDAKALEKLGAVVFDRLVPKIRITKIAGNVVLSDENPANLPVDKWFVVPVYAYKSENDWWGKVEMVKDPQRQINKRASQAIDIMNKHSSYGRYYDASTFPNKKEEQKFLRNRNKPGFVQRVNDAAKIPAREDGGKFPAEIVESMNLSLTMHEQLMNVTLPPGGANESGAHMLHRQKQQLAGNEFLFDNLRLAKERLGLLLLHLIHRYYSPQRIYELIESANQQNAVQVGGQPFDQWTYDEIVQLLEDADPYQYKIVVSESENSPSIQFATWMLLESLAQSGAEIPPQMLVESADLPEDRKRKLLEYQEQQMQAQAQSAADQKDGEVLKTLIAQGYLPPQVAEQYGIGQQQGQAQLPAPEPQTEPDPTLTQ